MRDQRVGADAPPGGDLRAHAVALALLAEVGAPLPAGDRDVDRRLERVQPHLPVAAVDDRTDVAGAQAVARDQLERRSAQLLGAVGHRHVVELGRAQQPVDVLGVAEHRRPELGVVAAHAVEDAGAVVQAVREHVDLGVLPRDEVSVHPDEVGGLHCCEAPVRGSRAPPRSPAQCPPPSEVGRAQPRRERALNSRFYSRRLAFQTEPVAQQERGREEHRERVGDPVPGDVGRGAVHRLEQAGAAGPRARRWGACRSSR